MLLLLPFKEKIILALRATLKSGFSDTVNSQFAESNNLMDWLLVTNNSGDHVLKEFNFKREETVNRNMKG